MADPVPSAASAPSEGYESHLVDRRRTDRNHLLALSIFHYLLAVIAAVNCAALVRAVVGMYRFQLAAWRDTSMEGGHVVGSHVWLMNWFVLVLAGVCGLAMVLNFASGWCMTQRKAWFLSVVVAGLDLIYFPLGTLLGVFTLIVLLRGSVKEWYRENAAPMAGGGPVSQPPVIRGLAG